MYQCPVCKLDEENIASPLEKHENKIEIMLVFSQKHKINITIFTCRKLHKFLLEKYEQDKLEGCNLKEIVNPEGKFGRTFSIPCSSNE